MFDLCRTLSIHWFSACNVNVSGAILNVMTMFIEFMSREALTATYL